MFQTIHKRYDDLKCNDLEIPLRKICTNVMTPNREILLTFGYAIKIRRCFPVFARNVFNIIRMDNSVKDLLTIVNLMHS